MSGPAPDVAPRPLRLAHRGDHRVAPENTLAAFAAALAVPGCDGLEFDVRLAADGTPVVIHDETLDRVQGRPGRAADLDADAIVGAGIPTLAATLAHVPPPAFLDVELKVDGGEAVVAVLEAARGDGRGGLVRAVVSSFEGEAIRTLRRLRPGWPAWLNADDLAPATIALAVELGCRGIAAERRAIDETTAERVRSAGLELAAWTVVTRAERERLAALGVVAVCVESEALASA